MPIDALLVDGKRYLYFYCYDAAAKQKRVYIGPVRDAGSKRKSRILDRRYRSVRAVKKRLLVHLSRLAIYHALGDSAATAIERLAIAEELANMAVVVGG
ncbi:MAG: hypothetical protein ABSG45_04740 [Nitrososphaerales archaeon]|jgi:hypothetical protein